jgi:hypothetical protein
MNENPAHERGSDLTRLIPAAAAGCAVLLSVADMVVNPNHVSFRAANRAGESLLEENIRELRQFGDQACELLEQRDPGRMQNIITDYSEDLERPPSKPLSERKAFMDWVQRAYSGNEARQITENLLRDCIDEAGSALGELEYISRGGTAPRRGVVIME